MKHDALTAMNTKKYVVALATRGNPDYGQNPNQPLPGVENRLVEVDSFMEASHVCVAFISNNDLGSGNWASGNVYENSKQVAKVSYNGRVTTLDGKQVF